MTARTEPSNAHRAADLPGAGASPGSPAGANSPRTQLWRWAGWFCVLNLPLFFLVGARYVQFMGWPAEWSARALVLLICVAHFSLLSMLCWPVIALAALLVPRRWFALPVGILVAGSLLCGLAVDTVVLNLYRFHLNGMVWGLITNGGFGEIITLSWNTWLQAWTFVIGVVAIECFLAWLAWRWRDRVGKAGRLVTASLLAVFGLAMLSYLGAYARDYTPVIRLSRALPAFTPLTANQALRKLGFPVLAGTQAPRISASKSVRYPLAATPCQPPSSPLNLVVIVVDGWRFDMISEQASPRLHQFAAQNVHFQNHSAAARCTRFGIFSLFYGIYGSYWHPILLAQRGPVLMDALDEAHYQFGIFASAPMYDPEFDRTVFSRIRQQLPPNPGLKSAVERDAAITDRMLDFLKNRQPDKPFFGFLFYDATHAYAYPKDAATPFQPVCASVDHLKLSNQTDPVPIRNRYLNAVHYVDSLAGRVLDTLQASNLLDHTVVVVTGDHGEEFNETRKNYWGHDSNFGRYQTRVPFILHWPGRPPAVLTHATSHLDLAPTLMRDMLGCQTALTNYSNGQNLFDESPRIPLVLSSWEVQAIASPGRIDVMYDSGYTEHVDEDYNEIRTPVPANLLKTAIEGLSRFSGK